MPQRKHFSEPAPHHGGKQLAMICYEEITSLSPYEYTHTAVLVQRPTRTCCAPAGYDTVPI